MVVLVSLGILVLINLFSFKVTILTTSPSANFFSILPKIMVAGLVVVIFLFKNSIKSVKDAINFIKNKQGIKTF